MQRWHLSTSLKGTPSEILPQVDVQQVGGFEEFVKALKMRYQSTPKVCQQKFMRYKQGTGETPQQLGDELQRLARRSYPAAPSIMLDTIVASQFVVALANDEVRRFVILSHPVTLHEHVSAAIEAQALPGFMQSCTVAPVNANPQGNSRYRNNGRYNNNNNNGYNNNYQNKNYQNNRPVSCWVCSGPHYQVECPAYLKLKEDMAATRVASGVAPENE